MSQPPPRLAIAVLADFMPGPSKSVRYAVDRERFDDVLAAIHPALELEVPDSLADGPPRRVSLRFDSWRDFSPAGLVARIPELARAHELLDRLARGEKDGASVANAAAGIASVDWIERVRASSERSQPVSAPDPVVARDGVGTDRGADGILDLIDTGEDRSFGVRDVARDVVDDLTRQIAPAERAARGVPIPADAVAELQGRLDAQLEAILHAPGFVELERAWSGLRWLVHQVDFREDTLLEIVPSSSEDAAEAVTGLGEGDDVDLVIAAYEYDSTARDFERVQDLGRAGETIQTVVVTNLASAYFDCESWDGLGKGQSPRTRFGSDALSAWRSLRDKEESRWLVLVANRLAIRGRYAPGELATRGVRFTESAPGGLLAPAAWGVIAVVARSWARTRNFTQISGTRNGLIPDLPLLTLSSRPVPVEGLFGNDRREDLESFGVTTVQFYRGDVAFVGAVRTFRSAEKFAEQESTADSAQQVTLAYQIIASRLVKLLGRVVPSLVGQSREEAERSLREAVLAHFSRPGKPLGPDHVGVGMEDYPEDPTLTLVRLRVQPEVTIGGRPVNVLLNFGVGL